MQAIQQQPEELLSIMLAAITEVGAHGELSNAAQEVSWIHSILVALGIHLQPYHTSPTANTCSTTHNADCGTRSRMHARKRVETQNMAPADWTEKESEACEVSHLFDKRPE